MIFGERSSLNEVNANFEEGDVQRGRNTTGGWREGVHFCCKRLKYAVINEEGKLIPLLQ